MKKIYLSIILLTSIFYSCSLDFDSTTNLDTDVSVTTMSELRLAVNGVYAVHAGGDYLEAGIVESFVRGTYGGDFTVYADLAGGDIEPKDTYNQIAPVFYYSIDAGHDITNRYYLAFYTVTGRINKILSVIDKVERTEDDTKSFNDLKGQLYAMRALTHFDLARLYARIPATVSDINAENSGIVIADRVFETSYKGKRSTLKQTYDFILEDLTTALSLLDNKKKTGSLNYWGAKALEARAYLYLGENQKALDMANEVIENSPYVLYTREEYAEVWTKEGTNESIFEILTTSISNCQRNSLGFYTSGDGYAECGLSAEFKDFLDARPSDIRSTLYVEDEYYEAAFPTKYPGRDGEIYVNNPKVIRLSELYLIAAEADVKLNGNSGTYAVKYINDLRRNRIENYTDVASVSIDDVLTEARLEFFAEGHRAWDVWRNKKTIVAGTNTVNYDSYKTILLFPSREIAYSPELVQNPTQ